MRTDRCISAHLAGVYVPADIYARSPSFEGRGSVDDWRFGRAWGTHHIESEERGDYTAGVVDRYHGIIKKSFEEFGITFDIYSRTTSAMHHQMASDFFRTLYDKGEFIEKTSEQYYDEEAKQFLADPVISRVLVRIVETRRRMVTSARLAVRLLARRI